MRTLIMSCNTGAGHNSCAKAIQEVYQERGELCDIVDALQFISPHASRFISNWHTRIYRYAPKLFKAGYADVEQHESIFREGTTVYKYLTSGVDRMREHLESGSYDNIICTHVFPALAVTELLRRYPLRLQTSFVSTDYTCSPCAADSNLDFYFIPSPLLTEEFAGCGVAREKLVPSGLPAAQAFYHPMEKAEAKRALGIAPEKQHLLMMCGSMGCGPICELAELLEPMLREDQLLSIVCGTNSDLFEKLEKRFAGQENVRVLGLVTNMPVMMQGSDLLLTKPGGLSTTEAAASGLPMVLIDAVAGCEEHNLDFFLGLGAAETADTPEALAATALTLLERPERLAAMSAAESTGETRTPAEIIYETLFPGAGVAARDRAEAADTERYTRVR